MSHKNYLLSPNSGPCVVLGTSLGTSSFNNLKG